MHIWITLTCADWASVKEIGSFENIQNPDFTGDASLNWLKDRTKERLCLDMNPNTISYGTLKKPPLHDWYPAKRVVVRVSVDPSRVVLFDDNVYLDALGCGLYSQGQDIMGHP